MKLHYLDSGFYRISDKDAGKLAKATAAKKLPKHGYEMFVELPDGRTACLQRTHTRYSMLPGLPKRGWVWALYYFKGKPRNDSCPTKGLVSV